MCILILVMQWFGVADREISQSPHVRESEAWIPDSRYWIPVFVRRTWIPDSNRECDSGSLELYSGFQSSGFQIPQAQISLDSGIRYMHGATHE